MAVAGARRTIRPAGELGVSLAAKADGFVMRMESEVRCLNTPRANDDFPSVNARAGWLRVALEADYQHTLASGAGVPQDRHGLQSCSPCPSGWPAGAIIRIRGLRLWTPLTRHDLSGLASLRSDTGR